MRANADGPGYSGSWLSVLEPSSFAGAAGSRFSCSWGDPEASEGDRDREETAFSVMVVVVGVEAIEADSWCF